MVSGTKEVDAIKFEDGYIFSLEFNNGCDTAEFYKNARVKRPEPKQDTLQDVIDDLAKNAVDYWGCALVSCEKCPSLIDGKTPGEYYGNVTCNYARCIDVKRRLEAIQERMGGDA